VIELSAGDSFYFPAGMWHRVECEQDSISINISLVGNTWADVIADSVRQLLWQQEATRALVCVRSSSHPRPWPHPWPPSLSWVCA